MGTWTRTRPPQFIAYLLIVVAAPCSGAQRRGMLPPTEYFRGVAVLSSSIGLDVSIDEMLALVRTCKLDFVAVDFAWITHHWSRTDLAAVARLAQTLRERGVEVAVMYRPRALRPTDARVHYALNDNGAIAEHHNELCFAHADSRDWAARWGTRLLRACPTCEKIILYNARPTCHCPRCRAGRGRAHIVDFLEQCRTEWREIRPNVQIGHVGMADEYASTVDFLCPFLPLQRSGEAAVDAEALTADANALKARLGPVPVIPLIKTCWANATNNTTSDVTRVIRACDASKTGFVLWYYEWLFHPVERDYNAGKIVEALGGDWHVMGPHLTSRSVSTQTQPRQNAPKSWVYFDSRETGPSSAAELSLTLPAGTQRIPVTGDTVLISYLADRAWGHHRRLSVDMSDRNRVLLFFDLTSIQAALTPTKAEVVLRMHSSTTPVVAPFELGIYIVQEPWLERSANWNNQPPFEEKSVLVQTVEPKEQTLHLDVTPIVRAWLAGTVPNHGLLLKVANPLPLPPAPIVPAAAPPPSLTPPPAQPTTAERLPWPHQAPGLSLAQVDKLNRDVWVINNYPLYQAGDGGRWRYFHDGLDIVLDNGTKIYAMKDGWVKATQFSTVSIADRHDDAPCYGWAYTHLGDFQVKLGDFVQRGTLIGKVEFQGLPHIHLGKIYSEGKHWGQWQYACVPDAHFTYFDQEPPVIKRPFLFFRNNTDERLVPGQSGEVVLDGEVDIVVGMRDGGLHAHSKDNGFGDRLAVAAIDYEIRPVGRTDLKPMRFSSFDFHRLAIKCSAQNVRFNTELTRVVYKHLTICEPEGRFGDKTLSYYVITNCSGEVPPTELRIPDRKLCWNTGAIDRHGEQLFPDGIYEILVTARDFAGNLATAEMQVRVAQTVSE